MKSMPDTNSVGIRLADNKKYFPSTPILFKTPGKLDQDHGGAVRKTMGRDQ